jgi:LysR family transcriptional regulator, cys regulon transcriptional activator
LGLGVGILAEAAMHDEPADGELIARPLGHLLGANVTRIAFKRGIYLRQFVFAFAHMLSAELSPERVEAALRPAAEDAEPA